MRKASRSEGLSPIAEYKIRTGARGSRAVAERRSIPYARRARTEVWAPLIGFDWPGKEWAIDDNTSIRSGSEFRGYSAPDVTTFISLEEKDRCLNTRHWLFFTRAAQSPISAASYANAFLSTLWMVRPTPTYVAIRFEKSADAEYHAVRVLDRFHWIGHHVSPDVSNLHLSQVKELFPRTLDAYTEPGPVRDALVLAFRGCVSKDWQPAALCFGAALATLSRCSSPKSKRKEMAPRLAAIELDAGEVSAKDVVTAYRTAASVFDGRCPVDTDAETNLERLAKLSDVLRAALRGTLASKERRTRHRGAR